MNRTRVLVVDDEPKLLRLVRANLEAAGYEVLTASSGHEGIQVCEARDPDLIILDVLLPGGPDGLDVCRRIREFSRVPIIMLTAKAREPDKLKGFESGADDYLTKPFSSDELVARVKALLRRSKPSEIEEQRKTFAAGDLTINFAQRKVTRRGEEVELTPTEYKLLYQLATNAGKVMLHEELLSRVWGPEYRNEVEYLRAYVRHLRQKIEEDPSEPRLILSRPGMGYVFSAEEPAGPRGEAE